MKIIVAGFPKTGTKTVHAALEILGYNVYDFPENAVYLGEQWLKIFRDGWTTEDFRKMYGNVDAVADVPCFYFWEEIHKAFPDAKIILMMRDEDSWYRSFADHRRVMESNILLKLMSVLTPTGRIPFKLIFNHYLPLVIYGMDDTLLWKPFRNVKVNENLMRLKFRAHNAYVLQNAPPEKLLSFNVTEGWGPLCQFLDKPVPDEQFPHENKKTGVIKKQMAEHPIALQLKKELTISLAIISTTVVVGGYLLYRQGPQNIWNSAIENLTKILDHVMK